MNPEAVSRRLFLSFERPLTFFVLNDGVADETTEMPPGTYALETCEARLGREGALAEFLRIRATRYATTRPLLETYLGHGMVKGLDGRKLEHPDLNAVLEELDPDQYRDRVAELQLIASQAHLDAHVLVSGGRDARQLARAKFLEAMHVFVRLAAYVRHGEPVGTYARRSAIFIALSLGRGELLRPGGLLRDRFCQEPEMTPVLMEAMVHAIRYPGH